MTVSSDTIYARSIADGATDVFYFTFKCFQTSDIVVINAVSGSESVWTEGAEYTVTLNADQEANPGGYITAASYPADESIVWIGSDVDYTQDADLINAGSFRAEVLEKQMDRIQLQINQIRAATARSFKVPRSETDTDQTFAVDAADRADKYLGFDNDGNLTVKSTVSIGALSPTSFMQTLIETISSAADFRTAIAALSSAANQVLSANIAPSSITSTELADAAVSTAKITDLSVTALKLASNSVGTAKIVDNAVTLAKLAGGTANKYIGYNGSGDPAVLGAPVTTESFVSTPQTLPSFGAMIALAHGLTSVPKSLRATLYCATADHNWAVGDEIDLFSASHTGYAPATLAANATHIFFSLRYAYYLNHPDRSSGATVTLTSASWKYKIYAET